MLNSLDTLIAFVTIMSISSMMVLVIVQMIAAALSLRGKNMANALALTFQTLAPELKANAHKLAQRVLSDSLLSDSMLLSKCRTTESKAERDKPWSFWWPFGKAMDLASAIRPEEVYAALQKLRDDQDLGAAAKRLVDADPTDTKQSDALQARTDAVVKTGEALLAATGGNAELKEEIKKSISEASGALLLEIDAAKESVERWVSAAQDRAEQWFRTHTRGVTIAVSIVFAVFCQLDAVEIFQHVSTDDKAREALVKAGEQALKEADGTLDEKGGLPRWVADQWGRDFAAFKLTEDESKNAKQIAQVREAAQKHVTKEAVDSTLKSQAQARDGMKSKLAADEAAAKAKPEDAGLKKAAEKSRADLERQEQAVAKLDGLAKDFDTAFTSVESAAFKAYEGAQEEKLKRLQDISGTAGFDIVPKHGWRWKVKDGDFSNNFFDNFRAAYCSRHFFGIAIFAALLTLGAPYWFNLLKNLSSLRPALSQLIEGEKKTSTAAARK
ncbi:MAG: hypothetical protein K1X78_10215 [Verrucomicrobiaceae bacterium]|nr:hypothetical protein [Verrucomicrobiaceae bacterium]